MQCTRYVTVYRSLYCMNNAECFTHLHRNVNWITDGDDGGGGGGTVVPILRWWWTGGACSCGPAGGEALTWR